MIEVICSESRLPYLSRMWVLVLVSNCVEIGCGLCGTSRVFRVGMIGEFLGFFSLSCSVVLVAEFFYL